MKRLDLLAWSSVPLAALLATLMFSDPWQTPDQAGRRAFQHARFEEAAGRFEQPDWRAAALFAAGDFESTASYLAGVAGPLAAFNRGNALMLLGRYETAVESFEQALDERPGWVLAEDNRRIAESRIRVDVGGEGTGGMMGADDIVFDTSDAGGSDSVEVTGGEELADAAMREIWLRRVETKPADFLRYKFAYQNSRANEGEDGP